MLHKKLSWSSLVFGPGQILSSRGHKSQHSTRLAGATLKSLGLQKAEHDLGTEQQKWNQKIRQL